MYVLPEAVFLAIFPFPQPVRFGMNDRGERLARVICLTLWFLAFFSTLVLGWNKFQSTFKYVPYIRNISTVISKESDFKNSEYSGSRISTQLRRINTSLRQSLLFRQTRHSSGQVSSGIKGTFPHMWDCRRVTSNLTSASSWCMLTSSWVFTTRWTWNVNTGV